MLSKAFFICLHYQNMTFKQHVTTKKSQSSPEVAKRLVEIEQTLIRQNKFVEALAALMHLATENLQDAQVWLLVGLVYTRIAHWNNAISVLKTALQLDPSNNSAKQIMSLALFSIGQKEEACKLIDSVCKSDSATGPQWMLRAYLHAHTSTEPKHAFEAARDWAMRFADPLTKNAKPLLVKDKNLHKKLKVGYVTADFREHSIAFFMEPVLNHHDKKNFEIFIYSNAPEDWLTPSLKKNADFWVDVTAMSDEDMCKKIRDDCIDILVDLSGYTHGHRLQVFARRAAPVQVTWLGYVHTLGMESMDYRLVGFDSLSKENEAFNSETLFYLNGAYCYTPPIYSPHCAISPCIQNGYVTLISMNNSGKLTDEALSVWGRILNLRKDARLIILVKEDSADAAQAHMQPRVERAEIPLDRVSVMPQLPLNNFMELGYIADIALDTFPISGGTTTLHTLWMGLPIVTMQGSRDADAGTSRLIKSLAGGGLVSENIEEYINNSIKLIDNFELISKYRKENRDLLKNSFLMDYSARTAGLEKSFRVMWFNYLNSNKNGYWEEFHNNLPV